MKRQRFLALFLLSLVLFNFPLLATFSTSTTFLGIPLLYLYLFAAWLLCIGLAGLIAESS